MSVGPCPRGRKALLRFARSVTSPSSSSGATPAFAASTVAGRPGRPRIRGHGRRGVRLVRLLGVRPIRLLRLRGVRLPGSATEPTIRPGGLGFRLAQRSPAATLLAPGAHEVRLGMHRAARGGRSQRLRDPSHWHSLTQPDCSSQAATTNAEGRTRRAARPFARNPTITPIGSRYRRSCASPSITG